MIRQQATARDDMPAKERRGAANSRLYWLALVLIFVGAAVRVVMTYPVLTQTYDEAYHLATGMEWLDLGRYTYEYGHPPLARALIALGPYLVGLHSFGMRDGNAEGNALLHSGDRYWRNLSLARLGTLPFLLSACLVVWLWSNELFGRAAAFWSALLFSTLPPVLGHGGLATNDMAITATLAAALYTFTRWVENSTLLRSLALGVSIGLAVLSKFSALIFFPLCAVVLGVIYALRNRFQRPSPTIRLHGYSAKALGVLLVAFLTVWSGYRLTLVPFVSKPLPHYTLDRIFGSHGRVHYVINRLQETPLPAMQVVIGALSVKAMNGGGRGEVLFGNYRTHGWWYFFPVVLAFKTPVAFLALAGIGSFFILRSYRPRFWQRLAPLGFALAILLAALPSNLNLGIRYILPIYPLLAISAGFAAATYLSGNASPGLHKYLVGTLIVWQLVASARAHPDYLAYFNELALGRPERITAESDLDWGQDLGRLSSRLKSLEAHEVSISYFGTADLQHAGLPTVRDLIPDQRTTGWVAISVHNLILSEAQRRSGPVAGAEGPYTWLTAYQPFERVGKSIFLYNVPTAP